MVPVSGKEDILFTCLAPTKSSYYGEKAIDFARKKTSSMICHLRLSRPLVEGDNVEIKMTFHELPRADGKCLVSVTPPHLLAQRVGDIIKQNPSVIDPTRNWISHLEDEDYRRSMRFGIMYKDGAIQLRLPRETTFFPFHYVTSDSGPIWVDMFFRDYVKSLSLRAPLFPKCPKVVYDVEEDDLYDDPTLINYITRQHKATIVTV